MSDSKEDTKLVYGMVPIIAGLMTYATTRSYVTSAIVTGVTGLGSFLLYRRNRTPDDVVESFLARTDAEYIKRKRESNQS